MATTQQQTDTKPQCWRCKRTLAEYLTRPWSIKCQRCGAQNCTPSGAGVG